MLRPAACAAADGVGEGGDCATINAGIGFSDPTVAKGGWSCQAAIDPKKNASSSSAAGAAPYCWTIVEASGTAIASLLAGLWDCPLCDCHVGCGWGTRRMPTTDAEGGIVACSTCYTTEMASRRLVPPPTVRVEGETCPSSVAELQCQRGHYLPHAYSTACVPCLDVEVTCPDGFYPRACIISLLGNEEEEEAIAARCAPCALPTPLPPSMRYGPGTAFADCADTLQQQQGATTPELLAACAFFQTPKWGGGYCAAYCAPGFAQTAPPSVAVVGLPTCVPCATTCPAGFYPPQCPGGYTGVAQSPACLPCDGSATLPAHAHWVIAAAPAEGCAWQCDAQGYFALNGLACVPCPSPQAAGPLLCPAGQRWLGCGGTSPGACAPCPVAPASCRAGLEYLRAETWMATCACASCDRVIAVYDADNHNASSSSSSPRYRHYYARNCSATANALLAPCTAACVAGVSFLAAPCTPWQDTRCAPCTPPIDGRRRTAECTPLADARYEPCPFGFACNGSSPYAHACAAPRVAIDGRCVCPPATREEEEEEEGGGGCTPIPCGEGAYADPVSGACQNCSDAARAGQGAARARRGAAGETRLGVDAGCGCAAGYFATRDGGGGTSSFSCWPCGNLACVPGVERQVPSCLDAFTEVEPRCVCVPPPAAVLAARPTQDAPCALVGCADGYVPSSSSSAQPTMMMPAMDGRFALFAYAAAEVEAASSCVGGETTTTITTTTTTVRAFLPLPQAGGTTTTTTLVLLADGRVCLGRAEVDLEALLGIEDVRWGIRAHALLDAPTHAAGVSGLAYHSEEEADGGGLPFLGAAWLGFTFTGRCGDDMDDPSVAPHACVAFQLLHVFGGGDNNNNALLQLGFLLWGRDFDTRGLVAASLDAATYDATVSPPQLLFVVDCVLLRRYDVRFYRADTLIESRAPDPVVVVGVVVPDTGVCFSALVATPAAATGRFYRRWGLFLLDARAGVVYVLSNEAAAAVTLERVLALPARDDEGRVIRYAPHALHAFAAIDDDEGALRLLLQGTIVDLRLIEKEEAEDGVFFFFPFSSPRVFALDPWNRLLSSPSSLDETPAARRWWWSAERGRLIGLVDATTLRVVSLRPCPQDMALFPARSASVCLPLPCLFAAPCGPNSTRAPGGGACTCLPGFFRQDGGGGDAIAAGTTSSTTSSSSSSTTGCQPCLVAGDQEEAADALLLLQRTHYYCANGQRLQCPERSVTIAATTYPSRLEDCLCVPGTYHFYFGDTFLCLPCPTARWCPSHGTLAPRPCYGNGLTLAGGATSPLECVCPPRTHGLRCTPCDDRVDCTTPYSTRFSAAALRITGVGPLNSEAVVDGCLQRLVPALDALAVDAGYILYPSFAADSDAAAATATTTTSSTTLLAWNWVAVVVLLGTYDADALAVHVCACAAPTFERISASPFFVLQSAQSPTVLVRQLTLTRARACGGRHMEWSGSGASAGRPCTCVAGYEEVDTALLPPASHYYGHGIQCLPCLNGTARARRAPSTACTPCPSDEEAPFLGMAECVCARGLVRDVGGKCVAHAAAASSYH